MTWKDEEGGKHSGSAPPPEKNQFAVALGRLGASKGGRARAEKLSARRRSEIAREAARARWRKNEQPG
jgi:hypothetical protein